MIIQAQDGKGGHAGPAQTHERMIVGWEEWIALPGLALPAIKAKIDTGAKTSALHAEAIEPYGPLLQPHVRFVIHPAPRRPDLEVVCSAPIVDRRQITSSNGIPEERIIINANIAVDGRAWPIEISLSDRADMHYRMLLGRQALQAGGVLVDPAASFLCSKLSFKLYPGFKRNGVAGKAAD